MVADDASSESDGVDWGLALRNVLARSLFQGELEAFLGGDPWQKALKISWELAETSGDGYVDAAELASLVRRVLPGLLRPLWHHGIKISYPSESAVARCYAKHCGREPGLTRARYDALWRELLTSLVVQYAKRQAAIFAVGALGGALCCLAAKTAARRLFRPARRLPFPAVAVGIALGVLVAHRVERGTPWLDGVGGRPPPRERPPGAQSSRGKWAGSDGGSFSYGLPEVTLPSLTLPSLSMPSLPDIVDRLPSMSDIEAGLASLGDAVTSLASGEVPDFDFQGPVEPSRQPAGEMPGASVAAPAAAGARPTVFARAATLLGSLLPAWPSPQDDADAEPESESESANDTPSGGLRLRLSPVTAPRATTFFEAGIKAESGEDGPGRVSSDRDGLSPGARAALDARAAIARATASCNARARARIAGEAAAAAGE